MALTGRAGPYSIGSRHWPGVSKLVEEAGEVIQVCGKILGAGGATLHFDGSNLRDRLTSELADLAAAIEFVVAKCGLDREAFDAGVKAKIARFDGWHAEALAESAGADRDAGRLADARHLGDRRGDPRGGDRAGSAGPLPDGGGAGGRGAREEQEGEAVSGASGLRRRPHAPWAR